MTKTVLFDTRKAHLNLVEKDDGIQSGNYTTRLKRGILSHVVVHRLGYNSDSFKGAD